MNLGAEIKRLRANYGFGVSDTAKLAGLSAARIAEIESGAAVSTAELSHIANALGVDPAALHSGRIEETRRTVARFRSPQGITNLPAADQRLLALAAQAGRICLEVLNLLGKPPSPIPSARQLRAVTAYPEPWVQGYEFGVAARRALLAGSQPILSLQEVFEVDFGIHVAFVHFSSVEVEAVSLLEASAAPVVLLNKNSPRVTYPLSRRAILAHELCHLMHDGGERDIVTVVSRGEMLDSSPVEKRANAFAPSFLAPGEWVFAQLRHRDALRCVREIAETWGLSFEGAAWHAKNLKLITEGEAEVFRRSAQKHVPEGTFEAGLSRTPPEMFGVEARPSELSEGLLSELTILAAVEGAISKGRAREILTLR